MTDLDYIQPAERDAMDGASLAYSHLIADSVMRDLAEALRDVVKQMEWQTGDYIPQADAALARFDALNGDKP